MMPSRRTVRLLVSLVVVTLVAACRLTEYELELQPDGDTMQRRVSMWEEEQVDGEEVYVEFDLGKLTYISEFYDADVPFDLAQRHEFEGRFEREMPPDLLDGGWYLHQGSSMGSFNIYVEHVGGAGKIIWDLETRQLSLNRMVDVFLAWLDSEIGEDERYPHFRELIDVVIRDDLRNISLLLWGFDMFGQELAENASDEDLLANVTFRIGVYLAEREYFDPAELPVMIRQFHLTPEEDQEEFIWSTVLRSLANKLGTPPDEALPWPLAEFFENREALVDSFDVFVEESEVIRSMAASWEQEYWDSLSSSERARREESASLAESDFVVDLRPINYVTIDKSSDFLFRLSENAFGFTLFGGGGSGTLKVVLHTSEKPIVTNGDWHEGGTVQWRDGISAGGFPGDRLPDIFFAVWAEPAEEFQEKHFGQVVIEGDALSEYINWHMGLPDDMQKEWDDFLAGLEPGPELIPTLQNFCFSAEREECETEPASRPPSGDQMIEIPVGRAYSIIRDMVWELSNPAVAPDKPQGN